VTAARGWKTGKEVRMEQAALMRCIFGNPFQPVQFNPSCFTPSVRDVAQEIYDTRYSEDLPVLADALEEAGCDRAELLGHLRSGGGHVRGCWALDVLLGKQ
jgi:hypothetical protein